MISPSNDPASSTNTGAFTGSGLPVEAIAGGVVAAVFLVGVIGVFAYHRRRTQSNKIGSSDSFSLEMAQSTLNGEGTTVPIEQAFVEPKELRGSAKVHINY
jgi:hypothetical protein